MATLLVRLRHGSNSLRWEPDDHSQKEFELQSSLKQQPSRRIARNLLLNGPGIDRRSDLAFSGG